MITYLKEPRVYYIRIDENDLITAKFIIALSLAGIAMMGTANGREMKKVFSPA